MISERPDPDARVADQPPPALLPARMLNEFTYCPRLGYLEWVQGEFADNADTVEGRFHHRLVDRSRERARRAVDPGAGDGEPVKIHERSVSLASERFGLTAKIDLVEGEGLRVTPVDYKRGKRPHVPRGAYEPELVQLCAQGLLLREHGFECAEGVLYFASSRERVRVEFDDELIARTLQLAGQMREVTRGSQVPPPLVDSPKCPRCSLVGICLPDEIRFLTGPEGSPAPRPLFAARDDALPLHVQYQGARVRKAGEVLQIMDGDEVLTEARLGEISQVAVFGGVHLTTPAIQELCQRGIPICHLSHGGWFYGITHGMPHKNVELRRRQYAVADSPERCLAIARRLVQAKIANCRTLVRRNHPEAPEPLLAQLKGDIRRAGQAQPSTSGSATAVRLAIRSTRCCPLPTPCWRASGRWCFIAWDSTPTWGSFTSLATAARPWRWT